MASLRKHPRSPFWVACITLADGRRTQRSTKQTDRRKAQKMADDWEAVGRNAHLTQAQAHRVVADIYRHVTGDALRTATARSYFEGWAEKRKLDGGTAKATATTYSQMTRDFLASLGDRADRPLSFISSGDVAAFRDQVLRRTSAATANKMLKCLRVAFGAAEADELIERNPAKHVPTVKRGAADRAARKPFTLPQLKAVLANATDEWRGMILFGFYTGQRLGDIVRATWRDIDPQLGEWTFFTGKTRREMRIPLAKPLRAYLAELPANDDPLAPLFPKAAALAEKRGNLSGLSQQFHDVLVSAGLAEAWDKKRTGEAGAGRRRKRQVGALSFHSLRHTATSLLKVAGVAEAVARDIIGHDSEAVSRNYTHVESDAKRAALEKLPDL